MFESIQNLSPYDKIVIFMAIQGLVVLWLIAALDEIKRASKDD